MGLFNGHFPGHHELVCYLTHHTVVWGYLVCCVFVCLSFFVRLRISQRRKKIGREILHACWPPIRTGVLPFGELWLAGSHGGGITSGMSHFSLACSGSTRKSAAVAVRIGGGGVAEGCMVGFASCKPADALDAF